MQKVDGKMLKETLSYFYQATSVPIYLYHDNHFIENFSHDPKYLPPKAITTHLFANQREADYLATDFFAYYGKIVIAGAQQQIILGPIFQLPIQASELKDLKKFYVVDSAAEKQFEDFLNHLPTMPLNQFLNILRSLFFFVNHKAITNTTILHAKAPLFEEKAAVNAAFQNHENNYYNNSYAIENLLCHYVQYGQVDKLKQFIEEPFQIHEGKMANDHLRQIKNTAIVSITLITRAAIRGGLDTEYVFQLSDRFIQQIEQLQSFAAIQNLMQEVLFKVTEQVSQLKLIVPTPEFLPIIRYIQQNVNQRLTVAGLAKQFGYSRGYLSTAFKQSSGVSLQAFIASRKIEEAKQLLKYTDQSIATISNYLCYSSQSHFQTVFKRWTNQTPAKYRHEKQ